MPKGLMPPDNEVWFAERNSDGFLVALWLAAEAADQLVLPNGESADRLHVTLAYCGSSADMDELVQARVVTAIDDTVRYRDRLEGKIAGYGRFKATDSSDGKDVFYATPDVPRMAELRQDVVNCLMDKGVTVYSNHGWTPHITLAYIDSEASNPVDELPDLTLQFTGVTVMSGSRRIDIPFWTPEPEATISMSETDDVPLNAILGSQPARPLYFGSFDKEWIPYLPKPGSYEHQLFGHMDLTSETYEEMLSNFNKYVYKQDLPIRATHMPPDGGAIGWIRPGGMRLASDGSLEVKPEWNELGKGLVDDDRFRYVSAEFCKVWTNPVTQEKIRNVATGLALVTRPHFKTDVLNPLSEAEALAFAETSSQPEVTDGPKNGGELEVTLEFQDTGEAGKGTTMPEDQNATTSTPTAAEDKTKDGTTQAAPTLPAVTLSDLTQVVLTAEQRQTERQMFADLTTRVELAERRATLAEAELKDIKHKALVDKFTAEVLGRSAENGQPWFGNPKTNVDHLVSLSETYGEDSSEVRWAVTQKRNEAQAIRNTGIFDPISVSLGEDGASITAQVARLAEQFRAVDKDLTEEQATMKVYEENPELYVKSLRK